MAILFPTTSIFSSTFLASILLLFNLSTSTVNPLGNHHHLVEEGVIPESDFTLLEFPLNLEYLEAEFFLWGSLGYGLDVVDPSLAAGGAPPVGTRKAVLDPLTQDIVHQFGIQEVGHLRAIKKTLKKAFARPLLNLSAPAFAKVFDSAFEHRLFPPFDPYATSLNYLLASYVIPYVGLTGYVGANPKLQSTQAKKLVAGLLAVESGQDAVIRALLYERRWERVVPYRFTVEEFTNKISDLRNKLGKDGVKDEGLSVHSRNEKEQGKSVHGNVLAGDENSLGYPRTPEEILRIVYGSGNETSPGGFYPLGADGKIAKSYYDSIGIKHKRVV